MDSSPHDVCRCGNSVHSRHASLYGSFCKRLGLPRRMRRHKPAEDSASRRGFRARVAHRGFLLLGSHPAAAPLSRQSDEALSCSDVSEHPYSHREPSGWVAQRWLRVNQLANARTLAGPESRFGSSSTRPQLGRNIVAHELLGRIASVNAGLGHCIGERGLARWTVSRFVRPRSPS